MAVCDPEGGMHRLFTGALAEHVFADRPPDGFGAPLDPAWAERVAALVARHAHELAGVIVEPVVQGAGGMRFYSPRVRASAARAVRPPRPAARADEIATGFGRTGALFACEHAACEPDVMCVGKALTGGYLTLAATLCSAEVAAAIRPGGRRADARAHLHGQPARLRRPRSPRPGCSPRAAGATTSRASRPR